MDDATARLSASLDSSANRSSVLGRLWRGELNLWQVFWLGYFLPSVVISMVLDIIRSSAGVLAWWLPYPLQMFWICFQALISVAIWRSAKNVRRRIWAVIARGMVAVLILQAAGDTVMLVASICKRIPM